MNKIQDRKLAFGLIVVVAVLLFGGVFLVTKTGSLEKDVVDPDARASVSEYSFDWGEIGLKDGNMEKEFEIKNEGSSDLILSNVSTSCMCTTAKLVLGDQSSPEFGMHTKSAYKMSVPAGETVKLRVNFDPAFHGPSGVGAVSRQVKVTTNDPAKQELSFMLTAVVKN